MTDFLVSGFFISMNLITFGHHLSRSVAEIPFKPIAIQLLRLYLDLGADTIQSRHFKLGFGQRMNGQHR